MNIKELILKNRSYRKYTQSAAVPPEKILSWVDLARISPSARNSQKLRYRILTEPEDGNAMFSMTGWAGSLGEEGRPADGFRPSAYILVAAEGEVDEMLWMDAGIASEVILLAAVEEGYGGIILGSLARSKAAEYFEVPGRYSILFALALGKPVEKIELTKSADGSTTYYRRDGVHFVPKRSLDDILF